MPKEYFRQPDQFPTLTVLVSAPNTLAGEIWRATLPLAGLAFDGREDQPAYLSAVLAAGFGGATPPPYVTCRLLANTHAASYGENFDPRKTPLGSIAFELAFDDSFAGMTDVPLVFTVAGLATDGPAAGAITLPTITTNTTDLALKDGQGGALPGGFASEAVDTIDIDAATLQGHASSYFATAARVAALESAVGPPVADLTALRAVAPADRSDGEKRFVKNLGDHGATYAFDTEGTGPDDGNLIITPTSGTGRWFLTQASTGGSSETDPGGVAGALYSFNNLV